FKPGRSGNPSGRPKVRSLEDVFLKIAGKRIGRAGAAYQEISPETNNLEAALHALFESAQTGDNTSIKQVLVLTREFVSPETLEALRQREMAEQEAERAAADWREALAPAEPSASATSEEEEAANGATALRES